MPGMLRVDLTERTVRSEPIPAAWRRGFIGGKGLGARYLYEELAPGTDPLGPENRLMFLVGPLTGRLPGEPRYAAVTKSPLTGTFLDSYAGGTFPGTLAGALDGHLGLLVQGVADEPVRIEVEDGNASIHPAEEWGADTRETAAAFPDASVACIGAAGEQRVAYATIASDGGDHHAGRGGAGAVMGSKRLKAVAVHGTAPEPSGDLATLRSRYADAYRDDDTGRWQAAGETVESVDFANEVGVLSTRGWQGGQFDDAGDIGVEAVREAATGRENADDPVPGGFRVDTDEGETVPRGGTLMSLGAGLGIDDFDEVARLGATCDRLGMDVISAGNAVAWTMRAADAGAVDADIDFGDADAAEDLLAAIASRSTDLGDTLAAGVDAARDRFGADTVPTVKSMELPAYDPRGSPTMALAYATSDRGACHRRSLPAETEVFEGDSWDDTDRVRLVIREQTITSVLWSLIADDFAGAVLEDDLGAEWLSTVDATAPTDPAELLRVGERTWTLTRLFNVREGFDASDETLPSVFERPLAGGPASGDAIDTDWFDGLRRRYYAARGWNEEGIPTRDLLDRLDLLDVVDDDTPVAGRDSIARRSD